MPLTTTSQISSSPLARQVVGERAFQWVTRLMAFSVFLLIILIGVELTYGSGPALRMFGWHFLADSEWNPVAAQFGALPLIFGTLVSSAIALLIAVPLGIATAVYLTEMAPPWLAQLLRVFIELLAAVPSVILGLWGFFVMVPWLRLHLFPWLRHFLGFLPLFRGPIYGVSMLAGGIILAIMILPMITSISREILRSVPGLQREAAYALGATKWEVTRISVLSYAKRGLFGAVMLGLGRALGETMAVIMVIGNQHKIDFSLFAPGSTLATKIANEFGEAVGNIYQHALFEVGLVLLGVTLLVNALAQLLLKTFSGRPIGHP